MNRRSFVLGAAAAGLARTNRNKLLAAATIGGQSEPLVAGPPPNILTIIVDQMRYPRVFPTGVDHAGAFIAKFMPNLHRSVWHPGVKFTQHYTAAAPCSSARATLITGLYAHQSWMLENVDERPFHATSRKPALEPAYPTYGKLLRAAGYQTPFIGKWHLSPPPKEPPRLDEYGFEGLTYYDPVGANLEGTVGDEANGYLNDRQIADQAVAWLTSAQPKAGPWCLTVSFLDPHDIQYFWGGTEFRTYNRLFDDQSAFRPKGWFSRNDGRTRPPIVDWQADPLKDPPSYGYPAIPPNWESAAQLAANKPSTQTAVLRDHERGSGGISEDPNETGFTLVPDPRSRFGIAKAPYGYWQRGLDCYTQLMSIVDARIGEVLAVIPADQVANTIIVFTADHGSYAGAHGFKTGKTGTLYDEAFHVPFVVFDPSGRFTGAAGVERTGMTSSVDILPMLVGLGHNGSSGWRSDALDALYGGRHDMLAMLRSPEAPGRKFVLLASDDASPELNARYNTHLLGLRTPELKLGTYSQWHPGTTRIVRDTMETEFYDYSTSGGRYELHNDPNDPRVPAALADLLDVLIPGEHQAQLPLEYAQAQARAKAMYVAAA